jgi:hypothetical protein
MENNQINGLEEVPEVKTWIKKWEKKGYKKQIIDNFPYMFPPLVKRLRCSTPYSKMACMYCGNTTFRYHSKSGGKKYYQCEKCRGINH